MHTSPSEVLILFRARIWELQEIWMFKASLAAVTSFLATLLAPISDLIPILLLLIFLDFLLGVKRAFNTHTVSSEGFKKGFWKIIIYMFGIAVILLVNRVFIITLGSSFRIDLFSIGYICINEAISCLAHLTKMGFPTPVWLDEVLGNYHKDPFALKNHGYKLRKEKESDEQ